MSTFLFRLGFASRRLRNQFYIALASLFSVITAFYFIMFVYTNGNEESLKYDSGTIDIALKYRVSSPQADERILLVDIDERSLAIMAEEYGRWPWPRSVMAEFLAGISEYEPASIGLNIMYSDPDVRDLESDGLLAAVIEMIPNTAYPMTRLSPENDHLSEITAGLIPNTIYLSEEAKSSQVALLTTYFSQAHSSMGLNNLIIDDDGIVRRFQPMHIEDQYLLPSLAFQIAKLSGFNNWELNEDKVEYLINWRNKKDTYKRVSFVDLYKSLMEEGDFDLNRLNGKVLIIGATAPGLAVLKGTSLSSATDDNLVIATIVDDLINETGLTPIPGWIVCLITVALYWLIAFAFIAEYDDNKIDKSFAAIEILAVGITILSVSFTNIAFDLSFTVAMGLFFFVLAKIYDKPVRGSMRATMRFFSEEHWKKSASITAVAFFEMDTVFKRSYKELSREKGSENVYAIDNLFEGNNLIAELLNPIKFLVVLNNESSTDEFKALDNLTGVAVATVKTAETKAQVQIQISEIALEASQNLLNEVVVKQ